MKFKIKIFFILLFFFTNKIIFCANDTIGSDSAPSRQANYEFSGFNNRIAGFAEMEYGFSFQDRNTTCSFDSFFPVDGLVNLKSGRLSLNTDLTLEEYLEFTHSCSFYCNNNCINFSSNKNEFDLPSLGHLSEVDKTTLSSTSYVLKWSYDDKYIAINNGTNSLRIYYFNDNTITLTASVTVPSYIYDLDWRPNTYQIATAGYSSPYVGLYEWNVYNGTISLIGTANTGNQTRTVRWRPDGNYAAVLRQTSNELYIYSLSTLVATIDIPGGTRYSYFGEASWRSDGQYLATGYYIFSGQPELYVHSFDGSNLALSASAEVNNYVIGIDWHPTDSLIAVGLYTTSDNLRLFRHDASANTLTELTSARIGTNRRIRNVYWSNNGKYLGVAYWDTTNPNYEIYYYDSKAETFTEVTNFFDSGATGQIIGWSHDDQYVATCSSNRNLQISEFKPDAFYIKDGCINFNSNINFNTPVFISGNCTINSNKNKINFLGNNNLIIDSNSTIILKDTTIQSSNLNKISCADNTSKIIFDNVNLKLNEDFNFFNGAFEVINDLTISGSYTFYYKTNQPSLIHSNATIYLDENSRFSYAPSSTANNLISMQDETSTIYLNEATLHSTTTGLQLTNGKLKIKGLCFINSDASIREEGIKLGNGINIENNLNIDIEPESDLFLLNGYLFYKNIS